MKKLFTLVFILSIAFTIKAQTYQECEDFTGIVQYDSVDFNGWTNVNEAGFKDWMGNNYSSNDYVQMSAFNGDASEIDWLISPAFMVDPTIPVKSNKLWEISFESKEGFDNGAPLELFVSTDFAGDVSTATWNDITSLATFAAGTSGGYGAAFVPSGAIDISTYVDGHTQFYIAFKYTGGSAGITTTMQIDNFCYSYYDYTSIEEESTEASSFYPNPANDQLVINAAENCETVEIYSISGQQVMSLDAQTQMNINISDLHNGIYFVKFVNNDNTSSTSKLVKN